MGHVHFSVRINQIKRQQPRQILLLAGNISCSANNYTLTHCGQVYLGGPLLGQLTRAFPCATRNSRSQNKSSRHQKAEEVNIQQVSCQ